MRLSFEGIYKPDELARTVTQALVDLAATGVDELHSANLYLTPIKERRLFRLRLANGQEVDRLTFDGPDEEQKAKM